MPLPGETITVSGSGLTEVSKVVFPGNIEVTTGIVSDPKGKFFTVAMPSGVSDDGGALLIECSNGGAYSPAYFNFKKGVLLNFDGQGTQGYWGTSASMIQGTDIESASIGVANLSQGKYVPTLPARITSFAAAKNRCSEVWTSGSESWRTQLDPYIPATTLLTEVGFQFDIFVPQDWTGSGFLKICLVNGFNGGEWAGSCYNYVPWVVDGKAVPFKTTGWTTVTIPFSKFYAYTKEGTTFESILAYREAANYKNLGVYFENSDFTLNKITGLDADKEIAFPSAATSVKVYTDNWRIVSLKTAKYSDFPEDAK
jgi:hypothetical protein